MSITVSKHVKIPSWKLEIAREIAELTKKYKVFLIADLTGVPAKHIQMVRKKLNNIAVVKVVKPKIALKVFEQLGLPVEELEAHLTGQVMLIYSNKNPFELADIIDGLITHDYYGPGEVAETEITIPEGNTGLPAGPVLSVFSRLKIPTKVQGNVIYVAKDTVVAKRGDVISPDLASLLQKLGLALKEIKLKVKCAVDGKLVIPADKLKINIAEYEENIRRAYIDAFKLAFELVVPEPVVLSYVIQRAHSHALALATSAGFIAPETIEYLFRKALMETYTLAAEIAKYAPELGIKLKVETIQQPALEGKKEEKKEKREEEKSREESEEILAEGFSALFG